ncbi:MAG: hypothetical protein AVDCRST_MAG15-666 [uncultured Rubellimicrobium sp.]|uniref:Uncharacterized protein n=1 Tax=uncultured Rubellimicrobium sp. TaxID=543078 RepID=A0A6J4NXS5_9RHOB|nr:MAG: hypothetical protein AVDCRST_MAG15-666 [uncultured Rubellimicrobium sp.]
MQLGRSGTYARHAPTQPFMCAQVGRTLGATAKRRSRSERTA